MLNAPSADLSKRPSFNSVSPNIGKTNMRRSFFISPMVPIDEDMSDNASPAVQEMSIPRVQVNRALLHAEIRISPFDKTANKKMSISPGMISSFSTSKGTKCNLSKSSKYKYEIEDESITSSDDCLSYEEGRSQNAYADIEVDGMSKVSLLNLRRKTHYLARAPMKPRPCSINHPESCQDSDDSDTESPNLLKIASKLNKARRKTMVIQPFMCGQFKE